MKKISRRGDKQVTEKEEGIFRRIMNWIKNIFS